MRVLWLERTSIPHPFCWFSQIYSYAVGDLAAISRMNFMITGWYQKCLPLGIWKVTSTAKWNSITYLLLQNNLNTRTKFLYELKFFHNELRKKFKTIKIDFGIRGENLSMFITDFTSTSFLYLYSLKTLEFFSKHLEMG